MGVFDKICHKLGLANNEDDEMIEEDEIEERPKEPEPRFVKQEVPPPMPNNVVDFQNAFVARNSGSGGVNTGGSGGSGGGTASYKLKVVVIEPKSFDDAQEAANCLREKRPVLINIERTEPQVANRIIDFISGTVYAISGEIKKVGQNVFLCAPANVNVTYTDDDKKVSTDMPWLKK